MTFPSAVTTCKFKTLFFMVPYLTALVPEAPVEAIPPRVALAPGSVYEYYCTTSTTSFPSVVKSLNFKWIHGVTCMLVLFFCGSRTTSRNFKKRRDVMERVKCHDKRCTRTKEINDSRNRELHSVTDLKLQSDKRVKKVGCKSQRRTKSCLTGIYFWKTKSRKTR